MCVNLTKVKKTMNQLVKRHLQIVVTYKSWFTFLLLMHSGVQVA